MEIEIEEYSSDLFCNLSSLLSNVYGSNITQNELEKNYIGEFKKIFVAKYAEGIVGCAFLEVKHDYIRPYVFGYLTYVAVDIKYRNLGIGKKLLLHLLEAAKKFGCSTVELTSANDRVGAHEFYKALGFTVKKTTVFIKDPL